VDVNRLRTGEKIAGAAAVLLFIDLFLSWYSIDLGGAFSAAARSAGVDTSASGWQAFSLTDLLLMLTILVALAMVVVRGTGRAVSLPVSLPLVVAGLGGLMTLLVLYRILNQPGPNEFIEVKLPAFLGFLCVLAIAAGGWRSMRDESWEDAPVPTDVRPAPPAEGPRDPAPPPEAEPRA
jgi:hypothetical protein